MEAALPWIATAISAGGTIRSIQETREAEKAAARQREIERRQAEIANRREIRKRLAEQRRKRAAVMAETAGRGVEGGSPAQGAISSIRSKVGERVGFSGQTSGFAAEILGEAGRQARAQTRAGVASSVAALPSQLGLGDLSDVLYTESSKDTEPSTDN